MRASVVLATVGVSLTLVLGTVATTRAARPAADARTVRAAEVARIRGHFDSVLVELPARDLTALTPAQRGRRAAALATLRAYRTRGDFPHNYDFPGQAVPYFVDRGTGTLCAVAHLLATSGRRDIVDRVARTDNNVWVTALAGDTAFTHWLDANGLTLAEAARIQVPYMETDPAPLSSEAFTQRPGYTAGSMVTVGSAVALSLWNAHGNARGSHRLRSALGATAGAAALGLGAASFSAPGVSPLLGVANVAAGTASLWIASRGILRRKHDVAVARERSLVQRAVVSPLLPTGREQGAGVTVAVPF